MIKGEGKMNEIEKKRMQHLMVKIQGMLKDESAESYFVCAHKGIDNFFGAAGSIDNLLAEVLLELRARDGEKFAEVFLAWAMHTGTRGGRSQGTMPVRRPG